MVKQIGLGKLVAAFSLTLLLSTAVVFAFYKSLNQYLDSFVNTVLVFMSRYGLDLSPEQLWLVLGFLLLGSFLVISKSD